MFNAPEAAVVTEPRLTLVRQAGKQYDRLGIDTEFTDIMDIKIPSLTIPVKPGRNLAIIIEVAAMNHRQKKMGYNAAEELNRRLMESMEQAEE